MTNMTFDYSVDSEIELSCLPYLLEPEDSSEFPS